MKWFRLYAEIKDDPKMLELDDAQFRIWINLLSMASEAEERGVIPAFRPKGMAAALHTSVEVMEAALALFCELGMIATPDGGGIVLTNFMDRQYDNPSDRPEKVAERKNRMKERHGKPPVPSENATPTTGNDSGTTAERQKNDTYSDTDSETENTQRREESPPSPPVGGGPPGEAGAVQLGGGGSAVSLFVDAFREKHGEPPDNIGRYAKDLTAYLGRVGRDRYGQCLAGFFADSWAAEQGNTVTIFLSQPADRWTRRRPASNGARAPTPPGQSALANAAAAEEARLNAILERSRTD